MSTPATTPLPDLRTAKTPFAAAVGDRVVGFTPRRVVGGTEWTLRSGRDRLGTVTIEGCLVFAAIGHRGVARPMNTTIGAVRLVLAASKAAS